MTTITQITVFYVSRQCIIASPFLLLNHEVVWFGNDIQHHENKGAQQIAIHLVQDQIGTLSQVEIKKISKGGWTI